MCLEEGVFLMVGVEVGHAALSLSKGQTVVGTDFVLDITLQQLLLRLPLCHTPYKLIHTLLCIASCKVKKDN